MRILMIGDIVGSPGRKAIKQILPGFKKEQNIDVVVANAENSAGGSGLTPAICDELVSYGIDMITSGDHVWKKKEIYDYLDMSSKIIRPLNYPSTNPGKGYNFIQTATGKEVAVINLLGRVFMEALDNPFQRIEEVIEDIRKRTNIIVVDFHAEATSEKIAMGYFLDGKVSALVGTHTHVQTADETILEKSTAYITDLGMTGPFSGVIGRNKVAIIKRFCTQMPTRFEMADADIRLNGAIIEIDENSGKALNIQRVVEKI